MRADDVVGSVCDKFSWGAGKFTARKNAVLVRMRAVSQIAAKCDHLPRWVDLETFLGEQHYATTESAAAIAAYLRVVEKLPLPRRRPPQVHQAASRTLTEAPQQTSANTPLERALSTLLGPSPPEQFNYRADWPTRER